MCDIVMLCRLQHHYAVSSIEVFAECECNDHATECLRNDNATSYECACTGFTEGRYCERCQALYNELPYSPGQPCQRKRTPQSAAPRIDVFNTWFRMMLFTFLRIFNPFLLLIRIFNDSIVALAFLKSISLHLFVFQCTYKYKSLPESKHSDLTLISCLQSYL